MTRFISATSPDFAPALAFAVLLAACSTGSGHDCTDSENGGIEVTVLGSMGEVICGASVTASSRNGPAPLVACTSADAACAYCQYGGTDATSTITVTASGYQTAQTTVSVNIDDCGLARGVSSASIRLTPSCTTLSAHQNGVGQTWYDCTPAHTYDVQEATTACEYYPASDMACVQNHCDGDAGSGVQTAMCSSKFEMGVTGPCDCWTFQGPGAGHVHASDAGCFCASGGDPSWF